MAEPGRCATCRWWEPDGDAPAPDEPPFAYGECWLRQTPSRPDGTLMAWVLVAGPRPESVGLATRDDFGCVQWEAR